MALCLNPREGGDPLDRDALRNAKAYVYILTNKTNGTLYVGATSDLVRRIWEHKHKMVEGFTSQYDVERLVYLEIFDSVEAALVREKQMKKWNKNWKIRRIASMNPKWNDLYNYVAETFEWVPACAGTNT